LLQFVKGILTLRGF